MTALSQIKMLTCDSLPFKDVELDLNFPRYIEWLGNIMVIQNDLSLGLKDPLGIRKLGQSVKDLPQIHGSALVIDKSMASTRYFEWLPEISKYKGTIICTDRALYTVIEHRLPDYVCNIDSSALCISFFDRPDVKKVMDRITAVFSVTTNPLTVRHWHGKKVFFTPPLLSLGLTKAIMQFTNTPYLNAAGQVAALCWSLAYNLGANPIGLFGITHGYDKIEESEFQMAEHRTVKGPYGTVYQDPIFGYYNDLYLEIIKLAAKDNVKTYNTMKRGLLYGEDVLDISLEEFVETYD